jgi:hypothetical protein
MQQVAHDGTVNSYPSHLREHLVTLLITHVVTPLITLVCRYDEMTVTSQIYDKRSNIKIPTVIQYLLNRNGPLATTGCDHGAFVSTKVSEWTQTV